MRLLAVLSLALIGSVVSHPLPLSRLALASQNHIHTKRAGDPEVLFRSGMAALGMLERILDIPALQIILSSSAASAANSFKERQLIAFLRQLAGNASPKTVAEFQSALRTQIREKPDQYKLHLEMTLGEVSALHLSIFGWIDERSLNVHGVIKDHSDDGHDSVDQMDEQIKASHMLVLHNLESLQSELRNSLMSLKAQPKNSITLQKFQGQIIGLRTSVLLEMDKLGDPGQYLFGQGKVSEAETEWRAGLASVPKEELSQYDRYDMDNIWESEDGEYVQALIKVLRKANSYEQLITSLRGMRGAQQQQQPEEDLEEPIQTPGDKSSTIDTIENQKGEVQTSAQRMTSRKIVIYKLQQAHDDILEAAVRFKPYPHDLIFGQALQNLVRKTRIYIYSKLTQLGQPGEFQLGRKENEETEEKWIASLSHAPKADQEEYNEFDMPRIWNTEKGDYIIILLTALKELNRCDFWMKDWRANTVAVLPGVMPAEINIPQVINDDPIPLNVIPVNVERRGEIRRTVLKRINAADASLIAMVTYMRENPTDLSHLAEFQRQTENTRLYIEEEMKLLDKNTVRPQGGVDLIDLWFLKEEDEIYLAALVTGLRKMAVFAGWITAVDELRSPEGLSDDWGEENNRNSFLWDGGFIDDGF